jgi:acyl carrier protein
MKKENTVDLKGEREIRQIIAEKLGVSEDKVVPQASFVDDLGADSLDKIEIIMKFEDAFDIKIPREDAFTITTVQKAFDYLATKA